MSTSARALVSEEDFLALPESNQPIELVDGEVIVSPSPTFWHQEVLSRLVTQLRSWAAATPVSVSVAQAPLDVRFGTGRILQPDAMVFLPALPSDVTTPIDQVPKLCIEVLSSNRVYDRLTKRFIYAEAGVQEYWIVEPAGLVERRSGPGLGCVDEVRDVLRSELLPGFEGVLAELFG